MTQPIITRKVELEGTRRLIQDSNVAIRDVFDAIVELVTNADDRYQVLETAGKIEIELVRRRAAGDSTTLRVRDFADGMTSDVMDHRIGRTGGRVSGLERGLAVRGTNSRGAKDIAALGTVTYESLAGDGKIHKCRITPYFDFELFESSDITSKDRERLRIKEGTGTLVTLTLKPSQRIPSAVNLLKNLGHLVALRDILNDSRRQVFLKDGRKATVSVEAPALGGKDRLKQSFDVPGYADAKAKITIRRTSEVLEREHERFRRGGILIKSRHAIHEATLFDKDLETDPHALRFFGRLVCDYIDDLWNDFDQRVEERAGDDPHNPMPVLDPSRRSGLTRNHPFVKALFAEALKRLRPLVEEERKRAEKERATIESRATRKRLNALERAATQFMERFGHEHESSRDPEGAKGRLFQKRGYSLSPPFAQIIQGHSIRCFLRVKQTAFPEIESGASVQVDCLTNDVMTNRRFVTLQSHPTEGDVLQAKWKLKGVSPTPATGMRARVGPITAECVVEVLESAADRYKHIDTLCFQRRRYRLKLDGTKKRVRVLAPTTLVSDPTRIKVSVDNSRFRVFGHSTLSPRKELGVAICDLRMDVTGKDETSGIITAQLGGEEATADLESIQPLGAGIKIKLRDVDFGNQRYLWRQNVLEIAARHPALRRYLGPGPKFDGQHDKHFRVVLAEVIADAVCARLVGDRARANPEEYEDADWDAYYADYSELITSFLPAAHKLQVPAGG